MFGAKAQAPESNNNSSGHAEGHLGLGELGQRTGVHMKTSGMGLDWVRAQTCNRSRPKRLLV